MFGYRGKPQKSMRGRSKHEVTRLVVPGKKYGEPGYVRLFAVHRLVVDAFVGPKPSPSYEIRHLNDNPIDNRVENLKWGTRSENSMDRVRNGINPNRKGSSNGNALLTEDDIVDIRILRKFGANQPDMAKAFGTKQAHISAICLGKSWKHVKAGL